MSVVQTWKKGSTRCPRIMCLMRRMVFAAAENNFYVLVSHIEGVETVLLILSLANRFNAFASSLHKRTITPPTFQIYDPSTYCNCATYEDARVGIIGTSIYRPQHCSKFTVSEFTSPSTTSCDPYRTLLGADIDCGAVLNVRLKVSKTDPFRQGCNIIIAASRSSICAVQAYHAYQKLRPAKERPRLPVSEWTVSNEVRSQRDDTESVDVRSGTERTVLHHPQLQEWSRYNGGKCQLTQLVD